VMATPRCGAATYQQQITNLAFTFFPLSSGFLYFFKGNQGIAR
jgi:hypothetical protein